MRRPGRTVREAINRYQSEYNTSPSIQSICAGLEKEFGDIGLSALSPGEVTSWKARRLQEASPATVRLSLSVLKRICNIATRQWEWMDVNKISVVENPKVRNARTRWLSPEEEDILVASCPPWLAYIVSFLIQTGLRRSEALNLRWDHVYDDYILIEQNKEGRPKAIPLTPKAKNILTNLKSEEGFVFLNERGAPISPNHIEYQFRLAAKKSGLENLCLHCLRHTFASRLVSRSTPLFQVQALLGHKSPATTMRYAHLSLEGLRAALVLSV